MQHYSCDVCGNLIKNGEKRYLVLQQEIIVRDKTPDSVQEAYTQSQRDQSYVKAKEICGNCKNILDHFFNMRKEEVEQITKELEDSFLGISETELPPRDINYKIYCQCGDKFADEGEISFGHPNGLCYICGKFKIAMSAEEIEKGIIKEEDEEENKNE